MMIDDTIRNAESEDQIFFLLTSYIDTLQFGENGTAQGADIRHIGLDEVRARFRQLMLEFDNVSTQMQDKGPLMKEALYIYDAALYRLQSLDQKKMQPGRRARTGQAPRLQDSAR